MWGDIVAVRQSRMALHYKDVELIVRGHREPVRLTERHGGGDFKAVYDAWLLHRAEEAEEMPDPQVG